MLKIAIIGCGKIADDHLQQIGRIKNCQVVGVCDSEMLMATQLAERFRVQRAFDDVSDLLATCRPDIVHITTPPESHFALGMQCLTSGAHIYVEKPFTLSAADAEELLNFGDQKSLKITVGHDLQFSPAARRARKLIHQGYLGDRIVHLESYYCYDLTDPNYARALLADRTHWIRRLPGKLLQNVISHGIARIAEYLNTDSPAVTAHGFISPMLKQLGEHEIVDELRVTLFDSKSTTGQFTFSSQMRPSLNLFRIFGTKNGLELDQDRETVLRFQGRSLPSYAEKFIPPLRLAAQQLGNVSANLRQFAANNFHMKSGMKFLIESFYDAVSRDAPPPIPYPQILLTSRIMDSIFSQLGGQSAVSWKPRAQAGSIKTADAVANSRF